MILAKTIQKKALAILTKKFPSPLLQARFEASMLLQRRKSIINFEKSFEFLRKSFPMFSFEKYKYAANQRSWYQTVSSFFFS